MANKHYLNLVKSTEIGEVQQQYCGILTNLVLILLENYIKAPKQQTFELFSYLTETKLFKQNGSMFNFLSKSSKPKKDDGLKAVIGYYTEFKEVLIKNFKDFLMNNGQKTLQGGQTVGLKRQKNKNKYNCLYIF
jgi:hypothetical protein